MTTRKSTIPRSDVEFNVKQGIIANKINTKAEAWKLDEKWITNVFNPAQKKWEIAWEKCQDRNQRTKLITFEKNQAREEYEPLVRLIVKNLEVNTLVTDEERAELGIFPHDPKKTVKNPTTYPDFSIRITVPREVIADFRDHGSSVKAKPPGIHGLELKYTIQENSPKSVDELIHSEFDTHSPIILKFKDEERGKIVWMCGRWQNTKGEKGPWSEFYSAIIP
jgi:hypothetical protein